MSSQLVHMYGLHKSWTGRPATRVTSGSFDHGLTSEPKNANLSWFSRACLQFLLSLPRNNRTNWCFASRLFYIIYIKYTLWIVWEQNFKDFYQMRLFKCKMFVVHPIIVCPKSTRANSVQFGTPLAIPGLTEEQKVPAHCEHMNNSNVMTPNYTNM